MIVKTREEATEYCRAHTVDYLKKAPKEAYICPLCGSGTHKNKSGALHLGTEGNGHLECFACKFSGDIFDLVAQEHRLAKGSAEAFNKTYELFSVEVEKGSGAGELNRKPSNNEPDYTEKYKLWSSNLGNYNYHIERGISTETAKKYWLGYADIFFTGLQQKRTGLVIPLGKGSYTVRNIEKETEQRYQKKGPACLFNAKALLNDKEPVFVTEGEIDALSIIEAGGTALALGSTSNMELLINCLKKNKPSKGLILCMDNDEAGAKATENYFELLKENKLSVKTFTINVAGTCKDCNEALLKEKNAFTNIITKARANPLQVEYEQKHKSDLSRLGQWWDNIHNEKRGRVISTGFKALDEVLGGGIGSGLTGFGSIPALGKTTLGVQIANNMAEAGNDILFFTLELDSEELISKTISRLTAISSVAFFGNTAYASTSREIMQAWKWQELNSKKQDLIWYAKRKYEEYAEHIYTIEGEMDFTLEQIIEAVKTHIEITGRKPVVFVDYLQILGLQNKDDRGLTDKARADKLVKYLRKMAKSLDIPVIVISSFNRENYNAPVSFSAFKESGGIEYGADALIGLQFSFMGYQEEELGAGGEAKYRKRVYLAKQQAEADKKAGQPLTVQAVVLKSRYSGGGKADLSFLPKFNLFTDLGQAPDVKGDKELLKASEGKGSITAKDMLERFFFKYSEKVEIADIQYFTYNRARVTFANGEAQVIEAQEGRAGWFFQDVNTYLVLGSGDEDSIELTGI